MTRPDEQPLVRKGRRHHSRNVEIVTCIPQQANKHNHCLPAVLDQLHSPEFSLGPAMKTLAQDTSSAAERVLVQLWREMPGWRKMELVGEMNAAVKTLARAGVQQRFPNATPDEIERRLKDVLLGKDLAARVYGEASYAKAKIR